MGCHGEREKLEDARAEQKWGYIVCHDPFTLDYLPSDSCVEPRRLQIDLVLFSTVLHHSLHLRIHLRRRLRCRPLHGGQLAIL